MRQVGEVGCSMSHTAVDELLSTMLCPSWLASSWTNGTWDTLLLQQGAACARAHVSKALVMRRALVNAGFPVKVLRWRGITQQNHTWFILLRLKVHRVWIIFSILISVRCKIRNLCGRDLMCKPKQKAPTWAESRHWCSAVLGDCGANWSVWANQIDFLMKKETVHLAMCLCQSSKPFWWPSLRFSSLLQNQMLSVGGMCLF